MPRHTFFIAEEKDTASFGGMTYAVLSFSIASMGPGISLTIASDIWILARIFKKCLIERI